MFAGIPLRFWSLCLPVTCASKRERLRECCPLWLSEPSCIVSEHHSGCSAAPVPKRAKQQVPDRDVHQLASLTCRQAGRRHSWSISVIDTAYFFWHISEEDWGRHTLTWTFLAVFAYRSTKYRAWLGVMKKAEMNLFALTLLHSLVCQLCVWSQVRLNSSGFPCQIKVNETWVKMIIV